MRQAAADETRDLETALWDRVGQVPHGRVTTYGRVALALGSRHAARWVAQVLQRHLHDERCTCHRVVTLAGASPNILARQRLRAEGHQSVDAGVDTADAFDDFCGDRPLARLEARQVELAQRRSATPPKELRWIAALDVSYGPEQRGVAAYVLVDISTSATLWTVTIERPVTFPYITGLLSYRELPLLTAALEAAREADRLADVYLIDGSGILHPRGLGIAAHFGVEHNLATIGLTKRLLAGRIEQAGTAIHGGLPLVHHNQVQGVAFRAGRSERRMLYVSPGHRMDVETAARIVAGQIGAHGLPAPLHDADRLSRAQARAPHDQGGDSRVVSKSRAPRRPR